MSRDQQPDARWTAPDPADEPTTGPPAGAGTAAGHGYAGSGLDAVGSRAGATGSGSGAGTGAADPDGSDADADASAADDSAADDSRADADGTGAGRAARGARAAGKADAGPEADVKKRRKRRLFVAGIAVGAALIVVAVCAGGLAVISAVTGLRDDAADAREDRRLRDAACLALEIRLNHLIPPGATTTPQARAVAVRDENAATRIYVAQLRDQRAQDGWRQLLDARTAFAEALDAQAKSRAPAFYVAPADREGVAVSDQLVRWSPEPCAGPIHRLAAPDL